MTWRCTTAGRLRFSIAVRKHRKIVSLLRFLNTERGNHVGEGNIRTFAPGYSPAEVLYDANAFTGGHDAYLQRAPVSQQIDSVVGRASSVTTSSRFGHVCVSIEATNSGRKRDPL